MTTKKQPQSTRAKFVQEVRRIAAKGRKALIRSKLSGRWDAVAPGLSRKTYADYDTYKKHQALKLDTFRQTYIRSHDSAFYAALRERLQSLPLELSGARVLCLAARQGTEVRAFVEEGAFALGIDLNPGRGNRYVVAGDFHGLQFADRTVDVVYTNSIDHAFDIERLLSEARRVLAADGVLICEVFPGTANGVRPGFYESFTWECVDALLDRITRQGFELTHRAAFVVPWPGEQLVLKKIGLA